MYICSIRDIINGVNRVDNERLCTMHNQTIGANNTLRYATRANIRYRSRVQR